MKTRTPSLLALALFARLTAPALASPVEFVFSQISWGDGDVPNALAIADSEWFLGGVQLGAGAESALFADGDSRYGFINVVVADPMGSAPRWAIRNFPVAFNQSELAISIPGRGPDVGAFGLNIPRGTPIGSLRYVGTIDAEPRDAAPPVPGDVSLFALSTVERQTHVLGGVADGPNPFLGTTGRGPIANGNLRDLIFPKPAPVEAKPKSERIRVKDADVVKVAEASAGCAPGAGTRALKYLAGIHNTVTITDNTAQLYNKLSTNMGTNTGKNNGTSGAGIINGLRKYIADNNLPADVQTVNGNFTDLPKVMDLLKQGAAIIMSADLGKEENGVHITNHATFVVSVVKNNGSYAIKCVDDPGQGDDVADNKFVTYAIDIGNTLSPPGGGTDARIISFTAIVVPSPSAGAMLVAAGLLAMRRRR